MREGDFHAAIREVVAHLRSRLEDRLRGMPHLEPQSAAVVKLLATAEGVAQAAGQGNTGATKGALHAFYGALVDTLQMFEGVCIGLEKENFELGEERDRVVQGLKAAERADQDAETTRGGERQRLEDQIRALEDMVQGGDAELLASLQKLAADLVHTLDELWTEGEGIDQNIARITVDARESIPEIAEQTLRIEERLGKLSVRAAPIRTRELHLTPRDLAELEAILDGAQGMRDDYQKLAELLTTLRTDYNRAKKEAGLWRQRYTELRPKIDAAELIFPLLGQNPFALAETTSPEVATKRRTCGRLTEQIQRGLADAERALAGREASLQAATARIEAQVQELGTLRRHLQLPAYERLSPEDQTRVRAILLTFREPTERLSRPKLARILRTSELLPVSGDEQIAPLLEIEFFAPFGERDFRLFTLTTTGLYWRVRWQEKYPELVEQLARAREEAAQIEIVETEQKAEERARARATAEQLRRERTQAKAETRALRERQLHNPARILGALTEIQRDLLGALFLRGRLPGARDAYGWAHLIAAAQIAGLVRRVKPVAAAEAWKKLMLREPPLFEISRDERDTHLTWSPTGQEVCRLLGSLNPRRTEEFEDLAGKAARDWHSGDELLVKALRAACVEAVGEIPTDIFRAGE